MDTIFALATAQGKSGVAIIRLSGPLAHHAAQVLSEHKLPSRGMSLRKLEHSSTGVLDKALVLTFSAPESFSGEDVAELHLHGSVAVVSSTLKVLSSINGLRLAEPGEFTRRALENGKLDLTQVEGLADLIDSETESQRKQAQNILAGKLGDLADEWRKRLIRAAALIEATIDFADEDVPADVTPEVSEILAMVLKELEKETTGAVIAERIRTGFEVAIIGEPNVGKSTLLNALAGRQAAITSEYAGTTRDVIEVRMDLGGLAVTLLDTAGIRETSDVIEGMGISLARSRAEAADLRVFLADSTTELDVKFQDGDILVFPKGDERLDKYGSVSGVTGEGLNSLIERITRELTGRSASAGLATRERHRIAMERAMGCLKEAQWLLAQDSDMYEVAAEEMRAGIRSLESLVGRVDVENLLDEIFSSFCLGK